MTKNEYCAEKRKLEQLHSQKMCDLSRKFVLSNTTVKRGDIVQDHMGSVKVNKIKHGFSMSSSYPQVVYFGESYTKAGTPFKNGEKRAVWESNLIKKEVK